MDDQARSRRAQEDRQDRPSRLVIAAIVGGGVLALVLVADFHALRHTFITNLANSGVHPRVAQLLARRSTITLTIYRYTHSTWGQLSDALAKLPDLGQPARQQARANGTEGGKGAPAAWRFAWRETAQNGAIRCSLVQ